MAYATLADLRARLDQVGAGADKDALLQSLLDAANAIGVDLVGITFAAWPLAATERDIECTHTRRWLFLPAHQAASVTAVESISGRGTSGESTEDLEDWLEESDGRLYRDGGWTAGWYRVTAKWGYGPPPPEAVQLEIELAINLWRLRDASTGQSSIGVDGQGAVPAPRAVTWDVRNLAELIRTKYFGVVHA